MAHVKKFTAPAMGHMFAHYERKKDEQGEYIKFGNKNIDTDKTHLNYNLAENKNQVEFVRKRLEVVHHTKRKDINVFADWVVTAPKDLSPEQEKDFFKVTYDFLCKRYGKENCISAYVHKDEVTPHLHFAFMPIKKNAEFRGKTVDNKLSAKEVLTKTDLKSFHKDLQAEMDKHNIYCSIENGKTELIGGNKTIEELKKETEKIEKAKSKALDKYNKSKKELETIVNLNNDNDKVLKDISKLTDDFKSYFTKPVIGSGYKITEGDYKKSIVNFKKLTILQKALSSKVGEFDKKFELLESNEQRLAEKEQQLNTKEQLLNNQQMLFNIDKSEYEKLKNEKLKLTELLKEFAMFLLKLDLPREVYGFLVELCGVVGLNVDDIKPKNIVQEKQQEKINRHDMNRNVSRRNEYER